jgi:hypothetical protein
LVEVGSDTERPPGRCRRARSGRRCAACARPAVRAPQDARLFRRVTPATKSLPASGTRTGAPGIREWYDTMKGSPSPWPKQKTCSSITNG